MSQVFRGDTPCRLYKVEHVMEEFDGPKGRQLLSRQHGVTTIEKTWTVINTHSRKQISSVMHTLQIKAARFQQQSLNQIVDWLVSQLVSELVSSVRFLVIELVSYFVFIYFRFYLFIYLTSQTISLFISQLIYWLISYTVVLLCTYLFALIIICLLSHEVSCLKTF